MSPKSMSPKSIAILAALGVMSSGAIAFAVMPSISGAFLEDQVYRNPDSFNGAVAEILTAVVQHPEILNPAITDVDRENLRLATLKRMNFHHVSEYAGE
jgi:hypothetical protein